MNKYRIVYRQKIASEESDYGEWTDEFLRMPYLVAKNMNDAITFAKYYTKELGYDVEEYEWDVFEYEG